LRLGVLTIALLFIAGIAVLTALDISRHGLTAVSVMALIVLVIFTIGIVGALREPPRK
jgi:hypothetical protein